MKAIVVYDSGFGNTGRIAEAIRDGLGSALGDTGHAVLEHVSETDPSAATEVDLLVVGSPTNGFRPTAAIKDYLKKLNRTSLQGVSVAAFDTRFTEEKIKSHGFVLTTLSGLLGFAAGPISDQLVKAGGSVAADPEGFYVEDTEGPLCEGELERAAAWGRSLAE
jgi:flavodoxin